MPCLVMLRSVVLMNAMLINIHIQCSTGVTSCRNILLYLKLQCIPPHKIPSLDSPIGQYQTGSPSCITTVRAPSC
jgi:hypothetical protein